MSATKKKTGAKSHRKSPAKTHAPKKHVVATKKTEVTPPPAPPKKEPTQEKVQEKSYLVAIRLKGSFGTPWPIERALETLRLRRKFNAVLLENTPGVIGMLRTVKDYITWGEAKKGDLAVLLERRGEFSSGAAMTDEIIREKFGEPSIRELASALTQGRVSLRALWQRGVNPVFRLHSPSGGFEGSIKRAQGNRGELGRRDAGLSILLTQMA
jgi:large subunit ribosomal protein L30